MDNICMRRCFSGSRVRAARLVFFAARSSFLVYPPTYKINECKYCLSEEARPEHNTSNSSNDNISPHSENIPFFGVHPNTGVAAQNTNTCCCCCSCCVEEFTHYDICQLSATPHLIFFYIHVVGKTQCFVLYVKWACFPDPPLHYFVSAGIPLAKRSKGGGRLTVKPQRW